MGTELQQELKLEKQITKTHEILFLLQIIPLRNGDLDKIKI